MATNYPTALDTEPNPTITTFRDDVGFELDIVVSNLGDAIEAIEGKLGIDNSAVATSIDYLVKHGVVTQDMTWQNDISPAQITANQNDYSPAGLATATVLKLNTDAAGRQITGITGGARGRVLVIINTGSFNITLAHENAGSTAANRFTCPNNGNFGLPPAGVVLIIYDQVTSRWRIASELSYGNVVDIGTANSNGISVTSARADHVHNHPVITTGDLHTEYVKKSIGTTKGDILVFDGTNWIRQAVGSNTQVLTADSAQTSGIKWAAGGGGGGPSILDRTFADSADYVNSVAETTMYSFSIAGNTLGANGGVRLHVILDYLNNSAANKTLTIRIKLGATTLWGDTSANIAINANRRVLDIDIILFNTGATNSQRVGGKVLMGAQNPTTGEGSAAATVTINGELYGTSAIDTTAAAVIAITAIHSAADAATSLVRKMALLELLP